MFAVGLCQTIAKSPSSPPPTLVLDWANRVTANDAKVRASAETELVKGAKRSLPLLRRFLATDNEDLHQQTFEIIRRIGPPAIPLLVELLRHEQVAFRGFAADALIDLPPDTESIQPALRRALRDEDSMVAADAARALGAFGKKASPSVRALVKALSHEDSRVRIYAAERLWHRSVRTRARRPWISPELWAIRFPASDGRPARPWQASVRPGI